MPTHPHLLEHEILKTLYTTVSFGITGEGKMGKTTPVFKRDYEYSSLHFGTLVDILNSPEKYTKEKIPVDVIGWLKNHSVTYEEVIPEKWQGYYNRLCRCNPLRNEKEIINNSVCTVCIFC